nr:hypothetical protein [Actinacidiphila soli]
MAAPHRAAQLFQVAQQVLLRGLLRHKQHIGIGSVQLVVGRAQQRLLAVAQAKALTARARLDQRLGHSDPVQILQRPRLHGRRLAARRKPVVTIDQDVLHTQFAQAHGQRQPGRTGADDQHVGAGRERWSTRCRAHGNPLKEKRSFSFLL